MQDQQASVREHYANDNLEARILAGLTASGKDIERLEPDDLAPVDEFHTRGRPATVDLARLLCVTQSDVVLDLGSGLGGPARYLARTFGCAVSGVDLTPDFVATAIALSRRVGMAEAVTFRVGSALAIPFPDATFDVVWSQNVAMNIADRARLYHEVRRVLKPGGRYGFTDVVAGQGEAPLYPQPWASHAGQSHLLSADATRAAIAAAGLMVTALDDQTGDALALAIARRQRDAKGPSLLGSHLMLGPAWPEISANIVRNFQEGRLGYVQGVAVRPPAVQGG